MASFLSKFGQYDLKLEKIILLKVKLRDSYRGKGKQVEIHTATFPPEQSPNNPSVNETHGL